MPCEAVDQDALMSARLPFGIWNGLVVQLDASKDGSTALIRLCSHPFEYCYVPLCDVLRIGTTQCGAPCGYKTIQAWPTRVPVSLVGDSHVTTRVTHRTELRVHGTTVEVLNRQTALVAGQVRDLPFVSDDHLTVEDAGLWPP